jgi:hypothetical protein
MDRQLIYFSSKRIFEIVNLYHSEMEAAGLDIEVSEISHLREFMFQFFSGRVFRELYIDLASEIAETFLDDSADSVLQATPTPRIFRPKTIGTSYHCDYWYGHGVSSYTIWVPLTEIDCGNTFRVIDPIGTDGAVGQIEKLGTFSNIPERFLETAIPVLPPIGSAYVFKSRTLHGSPLNKSAKTRISFDFRVSRLSDSTSTKDLKSYYRRINGNFAMLPHPLAGGRILKYVCGGVGKNTHMQHLIIDAVSRQYGIVAAEQEAEIERFGFPMLRAYLGAEDGYNEIDTIMIASISILDSQTVELARRSRVKVWCCLEGQFLDLA